MNDKVTPDPVEAKVALKNENQKLESTPPTKETLLKKLQDEFTEALSPEVLDCKELAIKLSQTSLITTLIDHYVAKSPLGDNASDAETGLPEEEEEEEKKYDKKTQSSKDPTIPQSKDPTIFYVIWFVKVKYEEELYLFMTITKEKNRKMVTLRACRSVFGEDAVVSMEPITYELVSRVDIDTLAGSNQLIHYGSEKNKKTYVLAHYTIDELKTAIPDNFFTLQEFTQRYAAVFRDKTLEDFRQNDKIIVYT
jgi:hypothetical protein